MHFVRRVFLAGPEWKLGASLSLLHEPGVTFESASLLVNGRQVLSVGPGGGVFDRTETKPKVFVFGRTASR